MPVAKQNFPIRRPDPNIGPKSSPYLSTTHLWLHQDGEKYLLVVFWILKWKFISRILNFETKMFFIHIYEYMYDF